MSDELGVVSSGGCGL